MKTPQTIYLKDYRPPEFLIDQVDLIFEIKKTHTQVTSAMKIRKNKPSADDATPLILDSQEIEIVSVIADGMVLLPGEYETGDDLFKLNRTPDAFELEITNRLKPEENTSLEGLYRSGDIICTQCEAQGFRKITPFLDRPDVLTVYSCTIIADKTDYPVLLSNGNCVDSGDLENNRHYVRWEDPFKKPSYLFALVAGDLEHIQDEFITKSGRTVDLRIYSEKENISRCGHAMTSLKQAMAWDEKRFGLEYDLDLYQIVAINDFNAGAMENKGLNIFNSKYVLADPQTATDEDYFNIQGVIGHEYFHNWTGNRVTLKNWFQLSLKEGLTVFRDQEFSSDLNSRGVKRVSSVKNLRNFQFPEDSGPMTHPVRPESYIKMDNFYTMTVYEKGAELVRMIHTLIGEKAFCKGIDLYFEKFDGMAVTIEDFISVMAQVSGRKLEVFKLWYIQSGTPVVKVSRKYDQNTGVLELQFEQTLAPDRNQTEKQPLHIPVNFALIDKNGRDITPDGSRLLELRKQKEIFRFDNIPNNVLPSLFRGFSAPVKVQPDLTDKELAFLTASDTDEFNRWDCAQTLFLKEIKTLVKLYQAEKPLVVSPILLTAFQAALIDQKTDRAFLAKTLTLPPETEIKDAFDMVDVVAVHKARSFLKHQLAEHLETEFKDVLEQCSTNGPFSLSHAAMADRALKNLSLSYLGSLKTTESIDLIQMHFDSARNMTDELAAFKILSTINENLKKEAAEKFYDKWHKDKLVLDKWFAVQAASPLPDTLNAVNELRQHPDFSFKNPNKVRSLIYMFALQNHFQFHRDDGDCYRFVGDQIIFLDTVNHQVAARLAGCFNHWKKYDADRQAMMKKELERIISVQALSKNVYEIVSRALE